MTDEAHGEKVPGDPDGIDTIKTDESPNTGAAQATLTGSADQNGTALDAEAGDLAATNTTDQAPKSEVRLDPDPLADELSSAAADEVERVFPSIPPEHAAMLKDWLRAHIGWVQAELEHAKLGTPVADRAKLNP